MTGRLDEDLKDVTLLEIKIQNIYLNIAQKY